MGGCFYAVRTNVISLSRTRIDSDDDSSLEAEGKRRSSVRQLDRVFLISLERVYQKVLGLQQENY